MKAEPLQTFCYGQCQADWLAGNPHPCDPAADWQNVGNCVCPNRPHQEDVSSWYARLNGDCLRPAEIGPIPECRPVDRQLCCVDCGFIGETRLHPHNPRFAGKSHHPADPAPKGDNEHA